MARLLELVQRHLGKSWLDVAEWLRRVDANNLDAIEARLIAGDFRGVVAEVESAARRFASEAQSQFDRAGRAAAQWLDERPQLAGRTIWFDASDDRAVRAARNNELRLVREVSDDTRAIVRNVIVDGQRRGTNPREWARDIRDGIGLTEYQEQVVRNYRRSLETADWDGALGRQLTDGRADRSVSRLRRDGGSLTPKQIDDMVDRYRQNWIGYRAETIARTEGSRAAHEGIGEAFRQSVERGDLQADMLEQEWHAGPRTANAREQHQVLDGKRVKYGEAWIARDGTRLRYPGDPAAGAAHTANCRCTASTVIVAPT